MLLGDFHDASLKQAENYTEHPGYINFKHGIFSAATEVPQYPIDLSKKLKLSL